jgi:hypothetical protein
MVELYRDILYLILKELQNDKKALCSCLLVSKTWCEIIIPFLWKNPWKYLGKGNEKLLSSIIISHLSDDTKDNLIQHLNFFKSSYKKPLFDYISFCKHLNLIEIRRIMYDYTEKNYENPVIKNVILNLFINENRKFTHLYIPHQFDFQIHLIPEAKCCFSELQFLCCHTTINDNVVAGLTEICKSIKELELIIESSNNNLGIVKLIDTPEKLFNIQIVQNYHLIIDEPYRKILENSLIKHSNNVQCFKLNGQPMTGILSSFVNLKTLELYYAFNYEVWKHVESLSLPLLQILRVTGFPFKALTNIIENTSGYLTEIKIEGTFNDEINNKRVIQAIYQNCPYLKYLKLLIRNNNIISEFEKLLINCQHLNGLYILFYKHQQIDFDNLFKLFANSSPNSLFKFKFYFNFAFKLESLKLFFNNWKGRYPILLQTIPFNDYDNYILNRMYVDLIKQYTEEGIVKHDNLLFYEDFEWIQKNIIN